MHTLLAAVPVKFFIAVLFAREADFARACSLIVKEWGALDYAGTPRPFDVTDYYQNEMGAQLQRSIVAVQRLSSPQILVEMKLICNGLEKMVSEKGKRCVNLDAGYLDHNKLVLASAKEAGQKVYLDKGIYADLAGRYKQGRYQPFDWSFPDFRDGRYDPDFTRIRATYMQQLRERSHR
jgi:hypothetical protein